MRASTSARDSAISGTAQRMLTGTTTPPAQNVAPRNSWKRSEFSDRIAARSPSCRPRPRRAAASRAIRSTVSAWVLVRPAQMVAMAFGCCWTARCRPWVRYMVATSWRPVVAPPWRPTRYRNQSLSARCAQPSGSGGLQVEGHGLQPDLPVHEHEGVHAVVDAALRRGRGPVQQQRIAPEGWGDHRELHLREGVERGGVPLADGLGP